jgi:hypothetical protein
MNLGNVSLYGKPRDSHSRLHSEALKGSTTFYVGTNLDWKAGDEIALAPTSFSPKHGERVEITQYDANTGLVAVSTPLKFYHWGHATSTKQ